MVEAKAIQAKLTAALEAVWGAKAALDKYEPEREETMTAIDLLNLVAQTVWDFFNPDTWRVALLLLVAWGVLLLFQIRRLLRRLVLEIQFISSFPEREQSTRSGEKTLD